MKSISLVLVTLILLIAVGSPALAGENSKLHLVATSTQVADLARIIGGDNVEVTGLMGGGVDPHLYQFTESDIEAMSNADLVLYSGLHLEGGIGEVIKAISNRTRVHAVGETLERLGYTLPSASDPDVVDPHMWFDPRNWQDIVADVVEVLSEEDPDNAEIYRERGESYVEQLQLLYDWGLEAMSVVPERQRVLVTSHDAFQYFGYAFGWDVRGLQGISTQAEAGVGDIQELVDFVIEREIPAMFVESSVPPNTIEAVQSAARNKGWNIQIGAELFSDAMGKVGTIEGTYIGMVITNITRVVTAFGYQNDLPTLPESLNLEEQVNE